MKTDVIFRLIKKNSPTLLTVIGVAGMFGMTALAVKNTPKAADILNEYKNGETKPDKIVVLKQIAPLYFPSLLLGISSAFCIFYGHSLEAKRTAALITLYQLSETARTEYRDKVIDTIGEKKENDICKKVAEDRIKKTPIDETIVQTASNGQLFYDATFGRYFRAKNEAEVDSAFVEVQQELLDNDYCSVEFLWDILNYQGDATIGQRVGWDNRMGDKPKAKWLNGYIETPLGEPAKAFIYSVNPVYEYDY